jgi:hypothetical protein
MTMRNPLGGEQEMIRPAFDAGKQYRYTWPGQPPKMVSGAELSDICKGADPSQLSIEEVVSSRFAIPVPESSPKGER